MKGHEVEPWCALAVAILFECPITPEEALGLYEDGFIVLDGRKHRAGTVIKACRISRLRERGCAWWAIAELTGIVSPESYINNRRGIVTEVERRNRNMFREMETGLDTLDRQKQWCLEQGGFLEHYCKGRENTCGI